MEGDAPSQNSDLSESKRNAGHPEWLSTEGLYSPQKVAQLIYGSTAGGVDVSIVNPKPSDEPLGDILSQKGIKEDRDIARSLFRIVDSPLGYCDRRRQSPYVSQVPVEDTCGVPLSKVYPMVSDSVTQVLNKTRGTVIFGTAFKMCDEQSDKCFYTTNEHNAEHSDFVGLVAQDGKTVKYSRVLAHNGNRDLVLVEVPEGDTRPPVSIGAPPKQNDPVFVAGHPYGYPHQVVAAGRVNSTNETYLAPYVENNENKTLDGVIETDVIVYPGNSGGPLFDAAGKAVSVVTLEADLPGGGSVAVPISDAVKLMRDYQANPGRQDY